MSTPERPLTRRQLKEMRRTGQIPVVVPEPADPAVDGVEGERGAPAPAEAQTPDAGEEKAAAAAPSADDGEKNEDTAEATEPRPLTRREARMRRTNVVPVARPESQDDDEAERSVPKPIVSEPEDAEHSGASRTLPAGFEGVAPESVGVGDDSEGVAADIGGVGAGRPGTAERIAVPSDTASAGKKDEPRDGSDGDERPTVGASFGAAVFQQAEERQRQEREAAEREAAERRQAKERETTSQGEEAGESLRDSTALGRAHDSSGSGSGSSALILKDMPGTASLSAPITATGELILTSSHTLPEGFGSRGTVRGTTDGEEVDATLVEGDEIPMHSSPMPIAAASAVSTSKAPGEVIRPPSKEKNHGLMLGLSITAGVLGAALIAVLVYAFTSGLFSQ